MSRAAMTVPRLIRPNATYAICRRIEGRRFLLRPDSRLTALFVWTLAVVAKRHAVIVHVAVVMSTHYHLVVTVPNGNVCAFMHDLNLLLANAIAVLRKYVSGVVWAPGQLSIVELKTPRAIVEQIAYAIANPVKAGLVHCSKDWPGLTAAVRDIGNRSMSAARPDFYFTGEQWNEHREASLELVLPTRLAKIGAQRAHALLAAELERQEIAARAEVKSQGWTVMGAVAAANTSPYRQAKSWRQLGKLVPHIAAGTGEREARIDAIRELKAFRAAYRAAKEEWIAGNRDVVFPAGTYWMRVHHGARTDTFA